MGDGGDVQGILNVIGYLKGGFLNIRLAIAAGDTNEVRLEFRQIIQGMGQSFRPHLGVGREDFIG